MKITEDIRSVTDLKRNTRELLDHVNETKRPMVLTTNGRAEAVLLDAGTFERYVRALNLAKLLAPAEEDVAMGRTRPAREFLEEFKREHKIRG
jgi:prevent-host-death family protein